MGSGIGTVAREVGRIKSGPVEVFFEGVGEQAACQQQLLLLGRRIRRRPR